MGKPIIKFSRPTVIKYRKEDERRENYLFIIILFISQDILQRGDPNVNTYIFRAKITAARGQCTQIECDLRAENIYIYTGLPIACIIDIGVKIEY